MSRHAKDFALALLAVLPFWLPLAEHLSHWDQATGFTQYDAPYYVANGREIFERGNGFAGPNPYDPSSDAPAIYFHWFPWLLGFSVSVLHFDPGAVFVTWGIVAGVVASYLTLQLVRKITDGHGPTTLLFLLTMWGGGILVLGAFLKNLFLGQPLDHQLLYYDQFEGTWFFNWGRNFILPTEALYHAFVAGAWLAVLHQRQWISVLLICILATTHPFSGLQHLCILGAWNLVQLIAWRDTAALKRGLVLAGALAAFLTYYFVYLGSFDAHRQLHETWSLDWTMQIPVMFLAYGPVGFIAYDRIKKSTHAIPREHWLFAVAFVISVLLVKHDLIASPRQPLHFTRGYIWMPLMLLALPNISAGLTALWQKYRVPALRYSVATFIALLACSDNLYFLNYHLAHNTGHRWLTRSQREMFDYFVQHNLDGILLVGELPKCKLNYLSATYTPARPYLGHIFNTPEMHQRAENATHWLETGQHDGWLNEIDYLLFNRDNIPRHFQQSNWHQLFENDDYVLFTKQRTTLVAQTSPALPKSDHHLRRPGETTTRRH